MKTIKLENITLNKEIIDKIHFLQDDGGNESIDVLEKVLDIMIDSGQDRSDQNRILLDLSIIRNLMKILKVISNPPVENEK